MTNFFHSSCFFQLLLICIISPFSPNFFNWMRCKNHRNIPSLEFQQLSPVHVYMLICRFVSNRPLVELVPFTAILRWSTRRVSDVDYPIKANNSQSNPNVLRLWLPDQLLSNFDRKTAGSVRFERSELMVNMRLISRWDWMTSEENNTTSPHFWRCYSIRTSTRKKSSVEFYR